MCACGRCCPGAGSERDDGGEQAGCGGAAGQGAAEFDGVQAQAFGGGAGGVAGVAAAGGAGEVEQERLAVAACPFGGDVGDDAAVVAGGELGWLSGGASRVDAVHPEVAQVDGVDEIAERPLFADRPVDGEAGVTAQQPRGARAAAYGLGGHGLEPPGDLRGAETGPVTDLHGRQRGLQRPAVLPAVGPRPPELADVLRHRRAGFAGPQHVLVHRADVPGGAVGDRGPRCLVQGPQQRQGALELVRLKPHGLPVCQRRDGGDVGRGHGHDRAPSGWAGPGADGRAAAAWQWLRNMATDSSIRAVQRPPPGSLETCWLTSPVISAVHRSRYRASVMPLSASTSLAPARARSAGAYDCGDGSKPGTQRWNSSWYRSRSLVQNPANRRAPATSSSRGSSHAYGSAIRPANWAAAAPNMAS